MELDQPRDGMLRWLCRQKELCLTIGILTLFAVGSFVMQWRWRADQEVIQESHRQIVQAYTIHQDHMIAKILNLTETQTTDFQTFMGKRDQEIPDILHTVQRLEQRCLQALERGAVERGGL